MSRPGQQLLGKSRAACHAKATDAGPVGYQHLGAEVVQAQAMSINDPLVVQLSDDEVEVLCHGINEWRGPARCTEAMAQAMGFDGLEDLYAIEGERLYNAIADRQALPQRDWLRVLLATEIVFVSDVIGSGHDWVSTTGRSDGDTLRIIRELQRKFPLAGSLDVLLRTNRQG